jgi:hypothetical protein
MGPNAFNLDLPLQLGIYDVVNFNELKLCQPPHLEKCIPILKTTILDFQHPLHDVLLNVIVIFLAREVLCMCVLYAEVILYLHY